MPAQRHATPLAGSNTSQHLTLINRQNLKHSTLAGRRPGRMEREKSINKSINKGVTRGKVRQMQKVAKKKVLSIEWASTSGVQTHKNKLIQ